MALDTRTPSSVVELQDLKDGMVISAYVGFDDRYNSIDKKTCAWLQLNFKGAHIVVKRDNEKIELKIHDILPEDSLLKIFKFPPSLNHILTIKKNLSKELDSRGFTRFDVQKPGVNISDKKKKAIQHANKLVQKIKESVSVCEQASKAVEALLNDSRNISENLKDVKNHVDIVIDNAFSEAATAVMSLKKNDLVYTHCVDVGITFQQTYFEIIKKQNRKSIFKDEKEAVFAAFLHDIGKAKIPNEILNSTAPFKRMSKEMKIIQSHPDIGAEILSSMGMPESFVNMAHYHHVKLDDSVTSSYPDGVTNKDILFETRLLSVIDTYQALVAGRSYKKSWTPPAVMKYLDAMAGIEFDLQLWNDFLEVMGHYPKGSLVELSDESLAFVVSVPKVDILKPQVVRVCDANGKELENSDLIDLYEEQDISIVKDVDCHEIFKERALDVFMNLKVT